MRHWGGRVISMEVSSKRASVCRLTRPFGILLKKDLLVQVLVNIYEGVVTTRVYGVDIEVKVIS